MVSQLFRKIEEAYQTDPRLNRSSLAIKLGTSEATISKAIWISKHAGEETLEGVRNGDLKISRAYLDLKHNPYRISPKAKEAIDNVFGILLDIFHKEDLNNKYKMAQAIIPVINAMQSLHQKGLISEEFFSRILDRLISEYNITPQSLDFVEVIVRGEYSQFQLSKKQS